MSIVPDADKTLTTATVAIIAGMIRVLAMCVSYVEATLALAIPNAPIVDTILASVVRIAVIFPVLVVLIAAMILAFAMMKIQSRTIRMTVTAPNVRSVED